MKKLPAILVLLAAAGLFCVQDAAAKDVTLSGALTGIQIGTEDSPYDVFFRIQENEYDPGFKNLLKGREVLFRVDISTAKVHESIGFEGEKIRQHASQWVLQTLAEYIVDKEIQTRPFKFTVDLRKKVLKDLEYFE